MTEEDLQEYIDCQLTQEIAGTGKLHYCNCGRPWHGLPAGTSPFHPACEGTHRE